MTTRYFALTIGMVYLFLGVLGFFSGVVAEPLLDALPTGYGYLLGLFPVNVLHNVLHLTVGILGLIAYRGLAPSIRFARGLAMTFPVLAVLGVLPWTSTAFGLIPLFGPNVWLHASTAAAAAYFAFARARDPVPVELAVGRAT